MFEQGEIQRIFYIHMPAFFGAFTAFGADRRRRRHLSGAPATNSWDKIALAGVEVGLAFALINLLTGSIWARPIWNTWWTWDPRLTSAAVMCLTYAAYLDAARRHRRPGAASRGIHVGLRHSSPSSASCSRYSSYASCLIRFTPPSSSVASPQNAQGGFEATERRLRWR